MKSIKKVTFVAVAVAALACVAATAHAATWAQAALGIDCAETPATSYRYSGVKVTGFTYYSALRDAGVETGDIITHVNGNRVRTYDQLQDAVMADSDGRLLIHVDNVRQPGTLASTVVYLQ